MKIKTTWLIVIAVILVGAYLMRDKLSQIWGAIVTVNKNQKNIDKASRILGALPEQGAGSVGSLLAAGTARLTSWLAPETTASSSSNKPPSYATTENDIIVSPTAIADDAGQIPVL